MGLTSKQVYEVGFANLRSNLKPPTESAPAAAPGQIRHLTGDVYQPSRLALVESWVPLAHTQHDVLIVAAPATDAVFYIGEETPVAIDALRTLVNNVRSRAPNPLSNILLRWTPKGWNVVQ
jgi:hypothetical protein